MIRRVFSLGLLVLAFADGGARAETRPPFSRTIDWSEQTIEVAREGLIATRERIANEQRPLLDTLTSVQSDLAGLRRDQKQLEFATDDMRHSVERLQDLVQSVSSRQSNLANRLIHLRREFEQDLPTIERSRFSETFLAVEQNTMDTPDGRLHRMNDLIAIVDSAIDRLDDQVGGHRYPATALADGVMTSGLALQVGPYVFFAPDEGEPGLVVETDQLVARLRLDSPDTAKAVAAAIAGEEARLPFDPLLDQAFLSLDARVSLFEHLRSGGLWIIPIMLFGLLSAVLGIRKVIQIRGVRAPETAQVLALMAPVDGTDFERRLQAITPLAREVFAEGHAYRMAPESARSAAMSQALLGFRIRIESGLSLIALTAAVAPLLGLLGTVTGMIKTFQVISLHGAGDARALSGGISEALVTTELGLVVAIPALLVHAWLNRRVRRLSIQTAVQAERFNKTMPGAGGNS
ncbi:MAG: MotA/TolQ/ExbB proton channel family protein [Opitutaceae bacterium]